MSPERHRTVWPLGLAAREGAATARHGRWTSLLVVIAIATCIAAPGAADAVAVSDLIAEENAWIDAGGYVLVVSGARVDNSTNPVPAAACDQLMRIDGISASFAILAGSARGAFEHVPGGRAPVYAVSPGATTFLGAPPTLGAPVIVTTGLAQRTGVKDGERVRLIGSEGLIATGRSEPLTVRVADSNVMGEEYDGALLMPTMLTTDAQTCFVRTDAAHHAAVIAALPTLLAYDGQPAVAQPRLFASEFTVDFTSAYEDRAFRWLWIPSAALLLLVWMITQWFRRSQHAIYATFGMRAAPRLMMQVTEWAILVAIGLPWGWGLGIVWALAVGSRSEPALAMVSFHAVLTVLAASVAVIVVALRPTGTLLDALKDRS